jgi:asparagine synthetase B (glutamine-hydrolysing)
MCGFIGTTNKHLAHIMLKKQEHRGPDALSWGMKKYILGTLYLI